MREFDIVIVGAGPAGANLARLIDARRYRVLLIDGSAEHDKVCGGLISPDAQHILARYDISLPRDILANPQLFSVRTIDLGNGLTRHYRRSYMNVDRRRLDDFFRSLIPDTIPILHGRCEQVMRRQGGFTLCVAGEEISCRYLVGADGAGSVVRRSLFANHPIHKYTAIQQWFAADAVNPYYSCLFDNATSTGCSWIFFKDGALIFGGAFDTHGAREAFEQQKLKLIERGIVDGRVLASPIKTEACTVARPHLRRGVLHGADGAFLIGEAAGWISPSSFEGISYALQSSEDLADAFAACDRPQKILHAYRQNSRPLMVKIHLRCLKRPFMYNQQLRTWVLKSGLTALHLRKGESP